MCEGTSLRLSGWCCDCAASSSRSSIRGESRAQIIGVALALQGAGDSVLIQTRVTTLITYVDSSEAIRADQLGGFFVDWPRKPTPERHLDLLRGSYAVQLALDGDRVVGFVTAISDGVLSAFIPLLEVLPDYRSQGIGKELMRRLLAQLDRVYMVDLCCDAGLEPFYDAIGFHVLDRGMGIRRQAALERRSQ